MQHWTEDIIHQWRTEGIRLNKGCSAELILKAEKHLDFLFPDQFKELYLKVDGFFDADWRDNMFTIWPIERIIKEHDERNDKFFVGFSDYLINSWQIGFIKDQKGVFKYYEEPERIVETFEQAVRSINNDSEIIYV